MDAVEPKLLLSGEVTPAFQVEVKPEVGGKVKQIHVIPGQTVSKGDALVTIDDTDLLTEKASAETEIEGASLAVDKTRGNYDRAHALFEQKLISKEVFANLEADFKISENTLEKAQRKLQTVNDRLSKTRILAPGDGTILDVNVNEGQVVVGAASVNSGTVLLLFADLSRLLINAHVNQMDAGRLSVGQEMSIRFSDDDSTSFKANIEFIAPIATVKNNIKGFEVQAVIGENQSRLKPGMSVSMDVPVGHADKVVTVPVAAVFKDKDQKVVYVRKGGEVTRRVVAVGLTDMSRAEIKSGLEEGEEILLVDPGVLPHEKS
jgi:RND family efflux transporter MFP subunit